jgi:hypothetical protein
MSGKNIFQADRVWETAEYLRHVVGDGWKPDKDTHQLMSTLCTMAWTVQQLDNGSKHDEIRRRLIQECTAVACHLLDKKCEMLSSKDK